MKKCKITVLKKYFDKELSKQYGADGLTACPMLKEGQEFYADWNAPKGFVMKRGKLFINMYLHFLTELKMCFIMEIGLKKKELLL